MKCCFMSLMLFMFLLSGIVNAEAQQIPLNNISRNISYIEEEQINIEKNNLQEKFANCGSRAKPIKIAGFVNYPPFGWVEIQTDQMGNEISNKNVGIGYALFDKIAQELGISVQNKGYSTYMQAQRAVRWGQSDVLLETYYDNDPYASLDIVFPAYLSNPFVIVSLKGTLPEIKDFSELAGKKGVVRREEMIWPLLQSTFPKTIKIEEVSGARNAFRKLIKKEVDFMITSLYAAEAEMRRFKIVDIMDVSQTVFRSPNIFMGFSQIGVCGKIHKSYFEKRIKELTSDKDFMRRLIMDHIISWEQRFKDEPSLLTEEGLALEDETAIPIQEENDYEDKKSNSSEKVDPESVIQQEMEKMKVSVLDPIVYEKFLKEDLDNQD